MEKQKMLYQQARLHDRGAAEMVLQMISASKGRGENFSPFCAFLTSSRHVVLTCVTRPSRRHGDCHPQVRHIYPERGEHPGPAGTWPPAYAGRSSSLLLTASALVQKMLDYLKEKRDVGFFKSLSGLMMSCR